MTRFFALVGLTLAAWGLLAVASPATAQANPRYRPAVVVYPAAPIVAYGPSYSITTYTPRSTFSYYYTPSYTAPQYYSSPLYYTPSYYAPTYYTPSYYTPSYYAPTYYTPSYYTPSYYRYYTPSYIR
jgi:hypothetical protein